MSYWSHNPEGLDEICRAELIRRIEVGMVTSITLDEVDDCLDVFALMQEKGVDDYPIIIDAEADYWGRMIDGAQASREDR